MVRGRSWVLAALAPALAACSLIYKSDLDEARQPRAARPDGGIGTVVPGVDGGSVDGGDDGAAVTSAGGCATYPSAKFCDDFDTQLNPSDGWDSANVDDGAQVLLDDTAPYSGKRSLRATLTNAPSCTYGRLEKAWNDIGTNEVIVSFRARPEGPWKGDAALAFMALSGCGIILGLGEDAPSVNANINAQYPAGGDLQNDIHDVDGAPFPDTWTDVVLDAVNDSGHVKLTVKFVHPSGAVDAKSVLLKQCSLRGTLSLGLGFHCSESSYTVRYDDVRVAWN